MNLSKHFYALLPLLPLLLAGCTSEAAPASSDAGTAGDAAFVRPPGSVPFSVILPTEAPVRLAVAATGISGTDAPETSTSWDLRSDGHTLFTNGGASGPGKAAAIGPLEERTFLQDHAPATPLFSDEISGAFLDWYFYEGAPNHVLWSRYHRYVVGRGDRRWLVQVLGYYGTRDGAPQSALYRLRTRELVAGAPTVTYDDLDGTAGGSAGSSDIPSECVSLATGARQLLTPAAMEGRTDVDLCVRRQAIRVASGARAADADAAQTAGETLAVVQARTAATEEAPFSDFSNTDGTRLSLLPDGLRSAFSASWLRPDGTPDPGVWVLRGANGSSPFFLIFDEVVPARPGSPGRISGVLKPVNL
jgi:hypothetical protein